MWIFLVLSRDTRCKLVLSENKTRRRSGSPVTISLKVSSSTQWCAHWHSHLLWASFAVLEHLGGRYCHKDPYAIEHVMANSR